MLSNVFFFATAIIISGDSYVPWQKATEYTFQYQGNLRTVIRPSTEKERISELLLNGHISVLSVEDGLLVQLNEIVKKKSNGDNGPWTPLHSTMVSENRSQETNYVSSKPFLVSHRDGALLLPEGSHWESSEIINIKRAIASELAWFITGTELQCSLEKQKCAQGCAKFQMVLPFNKANSFSMPRAVNPKGKEICGSGSIVEINQALDVDHCDTWPVFNVIVPPAWRCHPAASRCEDSQQLTSAGQMLGCFADSSFFPLLIKSHQVFTVRPFGILQHTLHVITEQQFVLKTAISKPRIFGDSASFAFAPSSALVFQNFRNRMAAIVAPSASLQGCHVAEVQTRWLSLPRGEKRLDAFREFRNMLGLCTREELRSLLASAPSMSSKETLMMATLAAGTNAAIEFAIETIVQRALPMKWTMFFFSSIPFYLRVPNKAILESLIALLEHFEPHSGAIFRTGIIAMASVVRSACFTGGPATVRFPSTLFGNACTRNDSAITNRYLALVFKKVGVNESSEDQAAALRALNVIGHEAVVPMVVRALKGQMSTDVAFRERAVLALHKLAHQKDPETQRILKTVYANSMEDAKVRLAAYTLLMLSNPKFYEVQNIALQTWYEVSPEVLPFVTTGIASFTQMRNFLGTFKTLSKKSASVTSLLKFAQTDRHSANNVFSYIERPGKFAFYARLETFMNANHPYMEDVYGRLNFNFGAFDFDVLEFSVHLNGYGETPIEILQRIFQFCIKRTKQAKAPKHQSTSISQPYTLWYPKSSYTLNHITWVETYERFSKFLMDVSHANISKIKTFDINNVVPVLRLDIRFPNSLGYIQSFQIDGLASVSYGVLANGSKEQYLASVSMSVQSSVTLSDDKSNAILQSGASMSLLGNFSTTSQSWEDDKDPTGSYPATRNNTRMWNSAMDFDFQTSFSSYVSQTGSHANQFGAQQQASIVP